MSKKPGSNLLYLDGLRALAAIYVLMHHAVLQYYEFDASPLTGINKISVVAFFYGHLAVNLFIVLSGFCLMLPVIKSDFVLKGGSLLFFKKRVIRILPPYYSAILLSVILIWLFIGEKTGTHWDYSVPITYKDIVAHMLLFNDFFLSTTFQINHSLWSIPVECRIYILFPGLIYLWRKIGPVNTLIVSISISSLIYLFLLYAKNSNPDINLALSGVNPYLILFTLGMLAAHYAFAEDNKQHKQIKFFREFMLIFSLIAYVIVEKINQDSISKSSDIAFGMFCFVFLILCSKTNINSHFKYDRLRAILSWQPLVFIGSFSYSLYLIHAPLLQLLSQYLIAPLQLSKFASAFTLIALSMLVIVPVSYLFFLLCEKPFMKLGKKMNVKQTEKEAVLNPAP